MRLAYADPPYLGLCQLYGHDHRPDGRCWNEPITHEALLCRLDQEYEGWAWMKPFASYKPGVACAYTWEPVLFRRGRDEWSRDSLTVRDSLAEPIAMRRGLPGAKPERFCEWVRNLLGYVPGDELTDIFPGTGTMDAVMAQECLY